MPDDNKFKVLRDIGYRIAPCCRLCIHGQFHTDLDWGNCAINQYVHQKHTGEPRDVSVHKSGRCADGFKPNPVQIERLGAHQEFLVEDIC